MSFISRHVLVAASDGMPLDDARQALREAIAAPVITRAIARRTLLAAAALAPGVLAACAGGTTNLPAEVAQDALLIANAFAAILPDLDAILKGGALNTVTKAITAIQAAAQALENAVTITAAQSLVIQLETALNAIVGVVQGLNLPGRIGEVITAASILIPVMEGLVNLWLPSAPPPTPALIVMRYKLSAPRFAISGEAHAWARLTLLAAAVHR